VRICWMAPAAQAALVETIGKIVVAPLHLLIVRQRRISELVEEALSFLADPFPLLPECPPALLSRRIR
jgi:hypothetical protein